MDASFITLLKVFYLTVSSFLTVYAQQNYYGLCADPMCSAPIGRGVTVSQYMPGEAENLAFKPNQVFQIYVKEYGPKRNLYGVMMDGKKGYIPYNLVREQATFIHTLVPAQLEFRYANTNHVSSHIPVSTGWDHSNIPPSNNPNVNHQVSTPSPNLNQQTNRQSYPPNSQNHIYSQGSSEFQVNFGSESHTSPHVHASANKVHPSFGDSAQFSAPVTSSPYSQSNQLSPSNTVNVLQGGQFQSQVPDPSPTHSTYGSNFQSPQLQNPIEPSIPPQGQMHQTSNYYSSEKHPNSFDSGIHNTFASNVRANAFQHQSNYYSNEKHPNNYDSRMHNTFASNVHANAFQPQSPNFNGHSSLVGSEQFSNQQSRPFHQSSSHPVPQSNKQSNIIQSTRELLKQQGFNMDEFESDEDTYLHSSQNPHKQADDSAYAFTNQQSSHFGYSDGYSDKEEFLEPNPSHGNEPHSVTVNDRNINREVTENGKVTPGDSQSHKSSQPGDAMGLIPIPPKMTSKVFKHHKNGEAKNSETAHVQEISKTEEKNTSVEKESQQEVVGTPENVAALGSESSTLKPEVKSFETQESKDSATSHTGGSSNTSSLDTSSKDKDMKAQEEFQQLASNSNTNDFVREAKKENSESNTDESSETDFTNSSKVPEMNEEMREDVSLPAVSESLTDSESISLTEDISEYPATNESVPVEDSIGSPLDTSGDAITESDTAKSGYFSFDSSNELLGHENVNDSELLLDKEQNTDLEKLLNISDSNEIENAAYLNQYQVRNLKADQDSKNNQNLESLEEVDDNGTYLEFDFYSSVENSFEAVRSFIEILLQWVPEPLYSILMDLEDMGISPRVPVFTALSAVPCILLIVAVVCIKEKSKEKKLIAKLALSEKNVYSLSAEKNILEEKLDKAEVELETSATVLKDERKTYEELNAEIGSLKQYLEKANSELESSVEEIEALRERDKQYIELVADHEKAHAELLEEKNQLECKLTNKEDTIGRLNDELHEKETELKDLQDEKLNYLQSNAVYEEKLSQLQQNCNQLLKEAEVWNIRVNELNIQLTAETSAKQELEKSLEVKNNEIESLTNLVQAFKSFEESDNAEGDEIKSNEEKLKCLMNSSSTLIKLQNQEEENRLLLEKLSGEKSKILDMEVEFLESKSENEKLRINYNQALQDKAEAQTKLDVLTNYFKDKEIQLQKQLGVQEAFRERREKDADSAERRICLIEQENASYKYQVASMKQEMEETERNLKNQIAVQEKKAHENWIAARAAERKLEDMKQEVTQLRQRLTLLEREQESWVNSSRDDVIRPIPKRIAGANDESVNSQDINNSMDVRHSMFHPPLPMMLPPDRPLPPLPPPPHLPPFMPPMDPHFRPQPWHLPPDPMGGSEFRITPPDFNRGRESTPPRGRHSVITDGGDMGPLQSSPLGAEMRDSRNSTPPHSLPDFHDIPPPPRPFFPPPPGHHPRYPLPPPFRRDFAQPSKRTDNQSDNSSGRGTHPSSVPQDNWSHTNSRV